MWVSTDMEVTFYATTSFGRIHVILKTITRTRTLKGGGFGLTWGGAHLIFSQRHGLCTHNHTYNLDYVLNYLDLKGFQRETGEKPREKLRGELGLGLTSQNNLDYLQFCCRLYKL